MDCDRYRRLTDANTHDETIHTTANHPWLTADHGWTLAGTLHVGEPVQEADGRVAIVEAVRVVPGAASMWDLTVSNVHDFAVGNGAFVVHNCGKVDYGSTELSKTVQDERIRRQDNLGNYGAATLDDGSTIVGRSRGRYYHAEDDLFDQADAQGRRITALYSEREPCGRCARNLASAGITDVSWSWDYRNVSLADRAQIVTDIKAFYRGLW